MTGGGPRGVPVRMHAVQSDAELDARVRAFESRTPREDYDDLLDVARYVRGRAYAPYSRFAVGAALLTAGGRVFVGVNVENASFGLTICAERAAVLAAVAAGERSFEALAIAGPVDARTAPCGACRQVLAEFGRTLAVWYTTPEGAVATSTDELLPGVFSLPA